MSLVSHQSENLHSLIFFSIFQDFRKSQTRTGTGYSLIDFDTFPEINRCLTDLVRDVKPTAESMRSGITDSRIHYSTYDCPA